MIVIDASVAIKWVLSEDGEAEAAALRTEDMIAPSFWILEAANALWRIERQGRLSRTEAAEALSKLLRAPVTRSNPDPAAALTIAQAIGHPVYDCTYLVLAAEHGVQVVTADWRFVRAVAQTPYAAHVRPLVA